VTPLPGQPPPAPAETWHRLHPLSPLVGAGRSLAPLVVAVILPALLRSGGHRNPVGNIVFGVVLVVAIGTVSWLVTRWRVEDGVLRIDSGLIRRTSKRFPLSQVQAVDTVRPSLARLFGLSELRLRMASSSSASGRLAFLPAGEAEVLRARLMALAHGVAEDTPAPPEQVLASVPTPLLLASLVLGSAGLATVVVIAAVVALLVSNPGLAAELIGGGATVLVALVGRLFARFNSGYRLTVAEAADGLRLRSGLVQTTAETIPRDRVQAVRMVEPMLWRLFGWCRLEVDVAGKQGRRKGEGTGEARSLRALLPVGSPAQAAWLLERVLPGVPLERLRAPARARWKSPLRYRNLAWGANGTYVVTTTGRIRRVTDWVPLAKVQSVRQVEGPWQRHLGLVNVHLDTAGRNVHAVLRDRDRAEGDRLMASLPAQCRAARAGAAR
jgi:putative membrane protein